MYILIKTEEKGRKSVTFTIHDKKKHLWCTENHSTYERVLYLEMLDNRFGKNHRLCVKVGVLLLKQHLSKEKICDILSYYDST